MTESTCISTTLHILHLIDSQALTEHTMNQSQKKKGKKRGNINEVSSWAKLDLHTPVSTNDSDGSRELKTVTSLLSDFGFDTLQQRERAKEMDELFSSLETSSKAHIDVFESRLRDAKGNIGKLRRVLEQLKQVKTDRRDMELVRSKLEKKITEQEKRTFFFTRIIFRSEV